MLVTSMVQTLFMAVLIDMTRPMIGEWFTSVVCYGL